MVEGALAAGGRQPDPDLCCSCVGDTRLVSYPEGTGQAARPD